MSKFVIHEERAVHNHMRDLTKGNPIKLMLLFALPVFLGNVFQLFYSLADTAIVGDLLGKDALAAVGATSSMSNLIIGFLFGLTNGFAILVARRFGEKNEDELRKCIAATFILGTVIAMALTILIAICLKSILHMLNTPVDLFNETYRYIKIIFYGMTVSMLYNVCAAVLRAIGDTITPLVILIASTTVNVGLVWLFIGALHMGVEGAAYATIIAQSLSAIGCIIYMHNKYPLLRFKKSDFKMDLDLYKNLMKSGMSMGLMNSFVSLGTVALQTSINTFGNNTIVAHSAARKITELYMLIFSVLGTTMATFASQNMGAGKVDRIKKGLKATVIITCTWSFLTILATYTIGPKLIYLVIRVDTTEVIHTAIRYLRFNCIFYFVPAIITTFRNTMQGIGDHTTPIVSSFIELTGKVFVVLFLTPFLYYDGIIISEPIVWFLMVIPLIVQMIRNPVMRKRDVAQ